MNQKLTAIKEILTSIDKNTELTFTKKLQILVKDILTIEKLNIIEKKYLNIHNELEGVQIFTSKNNNILNYLVKINLYKEETKLYKKWSKNFLWAPGQNKVDFFTIFRIKDSKLFILSLFKYIDYVKSSESETYSKSIQKSKVRKLLIDNQKKFGKDTYTVQLNINKYFKDNIEYYKRLSEESIEITNIQIFNGSIKFFIKSNINLEEDISESNFFSYHEKGRFGILSKGNLEKKFIIGKNGYHVFKESLNREIGEYIDFIEMVDVLEGKKGQDKLKMVDNAVRFANTEIEEKLKIKDFFLVEERAYKRQYQVNEL